MTIRKPEGFTTMHPIFRFIRPRSMRRLLQAATACFLGVSLPCAGQLLPKAVRDSARHERKPADHSAAASELLDGYDALRYRINLVFPLVSNEFSGTVELSAAALEDGLSAIAVHSAGLWADSVFVDGVFVDAASNGAMLTVPLPRVLSRGDTFLVRVRYHAAPDKNGFYFYPLCAYTMSEPSDARAWVPCKDVPGDKAAVDVAVTVPAGVEAASIGALKRRTKSADGLWETFEWGTDLPVATYLVCVTLSSLYSVWSDRAATAAGDSIECLYYVFEWDSANARHDFVHVPDAVEFFSERFGAFPFEKYGMAEVKPFNYGGMEHQTMTTINSGWITGDMSLESGFVHELAHSWWGDAVTLDDWPSIWLNEGFATYCESLFEEFFYGKEAFVGNMRTSRNDYFEQAMTLDFPLYNPPRGQIFNWGIVYQKGACVLHMLRKTVGDGAFWEILRRYYETYRYGNASIGDFQSVCETVSGMDLDWFFSQWIYREGFPTILYAWTTEQAAGGRTEIVLTLRQGGDGASVFHLPMDVRYGSVAGGMADTCVWVLNPSETFRFETDAATDSLILDPDYWLVFKSMRVETLPDDGEGAGTLRCTLKPNFPNPFGNGTTIRVECAAGGGATDPHSGIPDLRSFRLAVYNLMGAKVRSLAVPNSDSSSFTVPWDGTDDKGNALASGIYIFRLEGGDFTSQTKAVLRR
jgi:aminopeptidase N